MKKNRLKLIAIGLTAILAVDGIFLSSYISQKGEYSDVSLEEQITTDINGFLENYEIAKEELPYISNLYYSGATSKIASITSSTLTKSDVNYEEYSNTVSSEVLKEGSGLSEEQLAVITKGIETICIADTYKAISDKQLVSINDVNALTVALQTRINELENIVSTQDQTYQSTITELKNATNNSGTASASEIAQITAQLFKVTNDLRLLEGDSSEMDAINDLSQRLNTILKDLQKVDDVNEKTIEQIQSAITKLETNSLSPEDKEQIVSLLSESNEELAQKIIDQSKAMDEVAGNLLSLKEDCEEQKVITERNINNVKSIMDGSLSDLNDYVVRSNEVITASIETLEGTVNNNLTTEIGNTKALLDEKAGELSRQIDSQPQKMPYLPIKQSYRVRLVQIRPLFLITQII